MAEKGDKPATNKELALETLRATLGDDIKETVGDIVKIQSQVKANKGELTETAFWSVSLKLAEKLVGIEKETETPNVLATQLIALKTKAINTMRVGMTAGERGMPKRRLEIVTVLVQAKCIKNVKDAFVALGYDLEGEAVKRQVERLTR